MKRGCWSAQDNEKLVFMCDDGKFYKVSSKHKGPISDKPVKILYKTKSESLPTVPMVVVWTIDDSVYANTIEPETLMKCTSRGKNFLPEGAELISLGPDYTVIMSGRKKDKVLNSDTLKARPVGGKGTKIANLSDTALS